MTLIIFYLENFIKWYGNQAAAGRKTELCRIRW